MPTPNVFWIISFVFSPTLSLCRGVSAARLYHAAKKRVVPEELMLFFSPLKLKDGLITFIYHGFTVAADFHEATFCLKASAGRDDFSL